MRKRNIEEITTQLNKARIAAGNRIFTNKEELQEYLEQFGIKTKWNGLIYKYFKLLVNGKFPSQPIYIDRVKALYALKSSKEMDINEAISLLKKYGYKILEPVTEFREI